MRSLLRTKGAPVSRAVARSRQLIPPTMQRNTTTTFVPAALDKRGRRIYCRRAKAVVSAAPGVGGEKERLANSGPSIFPEHNNNNRITLLMLSNAHTRRITRILRQTKLLLPNASSCIFYSVYTAVVSAYWLMTQVNFFFF